MLRVASRIAVLACLLGAGVANAATVGISSDAAVYNVGDTITLTVFTDAEGEEIFLATAFVAYTGPVTDQAWSQTIPAGWIGPPTDFLSLPGFQLAFDGQAFAFPHTGTTIGATLTFSADAPGLASFTISGSPPASVDFEFGTATPGASVSVTIVPEPTTAALLGLGVLAVALKARR